MEEFKDTSWASDTLFVHGGQQARSESVTGVPSVQPIYTSTTFLHQNAEALDRAFESPASAEEQVYVYGRQGNPSTHGFESVMAQVEGGIGAVAFGSGMAAIHAALLAAGLTPGNKIVAARDLYGATVGLLRQVFMPQGITVVLHDLCGPDAAELIRMEQPDVVYVETLSNPLVKVIDLDAIGHACAEVGAVSIVDSTLTTPYLLRPIEHGFDLVVHSATKYLGGHGDSTAGVVISAKKALLGQLRSYATLLGAMLSPFEAHLMKRGIQTLPLRMERHCCNALSVAQFLDQHPAVAHVHYPGLPDHPQHELASSLLSRQLYGGMLSFELKAQSRQAVFRFMDALRLCLPATTLGDAWSLVSYPPISSHRDLSEADRKKMGITEGCIRLSVGIEDVEDIIKDVDQALAQAL
jgi:cystathionine beta-lyase/cystathionine gamma-synthase